MAAAWQLGLEGAGCRVQAKSPISPDDNITLEDFKAQLQTIDKSLRSLPATAQVLSRV